MRNLYKKIALAVLAGFVIGGAAIPAAVPNTAFAQKQEQAASAWHTYDDGEMTIQWKVEENSAKDKIVSLVFKSKSTRRFSLGWGANPQFILTTEEGDFPTKKMKPQLTGFNRRFDLIPFRLRLTFRGARGTAKALRITDIRPLDESGMPAYGIIDLTIDLESQE